MQSLDASSPLPVTAVFDVYCLYKQQAERRAKVALLTQDTMGYLTPRLEAMRDAFNRMPGVTIVADIAPNPGAKENPDVDVVLGATGCARALEALRAAGKDGPINSWVGSMANRTPFRKSRNGGSPRGEHRLVIFRVRLCNRPIRS